MSSVRVEVHSAVLEWARARSGIGEGALYQAFPKYDDWLTGVIQPTLKQLKRFAARTYTPFGYLLLEEPVHEELPVPDLRTVGDELVTDPSANLLETVFQCQLRQDWYSDHQRLNGEAPLAFIGTATIEGAPATVAAQVADTLGWNAAARASCNTWTEALSELRERSEEAGILVMISGYVGHTRRTLETGEFRGLALVDPHAPLVFVNGRDSKAAQVFTLVHEIAHLWLGAEGVSDLNAHKVDQIPIERWCNRVAAEVLVPLEEFKSLFDHAGDFLSQVQSLAEHFRVSTQVILGQAREAGFIDWSLYLELLASEKLRASEFLEQRGSGGGNYYNSKPVQVSKRFARALVASTLEGQTLYTDAFRLLNVKKQSTFDELSHRLGVA